jgi:hypothetical protein
MGGGRRKAVKSAKSAKKKKRPGGDPRKAGAPKAGPKTPAAAEQQPQVESMEDLAKMLEEAQASGGPAGFGGGGFPGMPPGGPGAFPPGLGGPGSLGGSGSVPAAFGKKRKKK